MNERNADPNVVPIGRPELVGRDFEVPSRVRSSDYGTGKIVADFGAMGVQIYWDKAVEGTSTHLLVHDRSWVERLEKLPPEKP